MHYLFRFSPSNLIMPSGAQYVVKAIPRWGNISLPSSHMVSACISLFSYWVRPQTLTLYQPIRERLSWGQKHGIWSLLNPNPQALIQGV